MGDRDWGHQLRWWAREYRRRAVAAAVRSAPVAARTGLMSALEHRDGGMEFDLGEPGPSRARTVVEDRVVSPAVMHIVPAVPDHPREEGHHWPDRSVFRLRDCRVDVTSGLVFHESMVLSASGNGWHSARDAALLSGAAARATAVTGRWSGPIVPMGRAHNYAHFLVESLPRLLRSHTLDADAVPVFSGPMPGYVKDVLDTLGIEFRIIDEPLVFASDNVVLCEPVPTNWPHPADYPLLREVVEEAVPVRSEGAGPERIYVTRRYAARAMRDEARLEDALVERGFTVVAWERLSFAEQMHTVRDASVIVGPHGTGLTNSIFCRPGTVIYELVSSHEWHPSFRHMSSICGNPHRLVHLSTTPADPFGTAEEAIALLDAAFADPPTT